MGCFNDLPKDVKWLVFREVIVVHLLDFYYYCRTQSLDQIKIWEDGARGVNPFVNLKKQSVLPNLCLGTKQTFTFNFDCEVIAA